MSQDGIDPKQLSDEELVAWRNDQLRKAQLSMRGLMSRDFGLGVGGEFVERVEHGQPFNQAYPETVDLLQRASSMFVVDANSPVAGIEQTPLERPEHTAPPPPNTPPAPDDTSILMTTDFNTAVGGALPVMDQPVQVPEPLAPTTDVDLSSIQASEDVSMEPVDPPSVATAEQPMAIDSAGSFDAAASVAEPMAPTTAPVDVSAGIGDAPEPPMLEAPMDIMEAPETPMLEAPVETGDIPAPTVPDTPVDMAGALDLTEIPVDVPSSGDVVAPADLASDINAPAPPAAEIPSVASEGLSPEQRANIAEAMKLANAGAEPGVEEPGGVVRPPVTLNDSGRMNIPVDTGSMGTTFGMPPDATQGAHSEALREAAESIDLAGNALIEWLRMVSMMLLRVTDTANELKDRMDSEDHFDEF